MALTLRDLAGFLFAALVPALVVLAASLVSGAREFAGGLFLASFALGLIHVTLFAIPIFAFLARRERPTLTMVLMGSVLVGALPALAVSAVSGDPAFGFAAMFGAFGLSGGFAFALVARPPIRR